MQSNIPEGWLNPLQKQDGEDGGTSSESSGGLSVDIGRQSNKGWLCEKIDSSFASRVSHAGNIEER